MSYEEKKDPRLGPTVIAYRQPPSLGWMLGIIGITFALVGGIGLAMALTNLGVATRHAASEVRSGFILAGVMVPVGIGLLVWGVLELVRKPEWHLCEKGIVRLSTGRPTNLFFWKEVANVTVVRVLRHGTVVGSHLRIGRKRVYVPNEAVANRAWALWAQENPERVKRAG